MYKIELLAPPRVPMIAGAVLAGGESRRMGRAKATLPLWDGQPMVVHVIRALTPVCDRIVWVGGALPDIDEVLHGTSKNRRERPECKAHGAQEPECIIEYTRIPSTAQRTGAPKTMFECFGVGSSRVAQQVFRGALHHLPDPVRGCGPLAAMETLLSSLLAPAYLIVACDQPLITPDLLRLLLPEDSRDAQAARLFSPQDAAPVDPFPGYYPATLLPAIQRILSADSASVQKLIRSIPVTWVSLPAPLKQCLQNINTPDDFSSLTSERESFR